MLQSPRKEMAQRIMSSHSKETTDGGRETGPRGINSLFEEYEPIINQILAVIRVPNDIRDDCYQAACLGLLKAEKKQTKVKFFKSYAVRCMKNEIIKEIARLRGSGQGIFSLDKITFLLLNKYKKGIRNGDTSDLELSEGRESDLNKLLHVKRFGYIENAVDDEGKVYYRYD
jgi:DNA-directed RNA polymerase specialized sigma subunit